MPPTIIGTRHGASIEAGMVTTKTAIDIRSNGEMVVREGEDVPAESCRRRKKVLGCRSDGVLSGFSRSALIHECRLDEITTTAIETRFLSVLERIAGVLVRGALYWRMTGLSISPKAMLL